jgi:hypothetical protein
MHIPIGNEDEAIHADASDDGGAPGARRAPSLARFGDALLLDVEHGLATRALWQGRPAVVSVQYAEGDEAELLLGMAKTIAHEGGAAFAPVRVAALADGARAIVVCEQDGGVSLGDLVAHVRDAHVERGERFPLDVACRIALHIAALSTWMPRMRDLTVTWDGGVRASPVPALPGMRVGVRWADDLRCLSPELVRGEPLVASRDAQYAAGVLFFELVSGAPPFVVDDPGSMIALLGSIIHNARQPLLHHRADVPAPLADIVDGMVALALEQRPAIAHVRAVLGARACSEGDAATFLAGLLRDAFPKRRAADLAFWDDARTLDTSHAPEWPMVGDPRPVTDLAASWRTLSNRASRTD